ncbi:MAG: hypothetical protein HQK51_02585 [Oligoflexia bacterium]|nr:hypothetical protein [Oligoflexia bacterium]
MLSKIIKYYSQEYKLFYRVLSIFNLFFLIFLFNPEHSRLVCQNNIFSFSNAFAEDESDFDDRTNIDSSSSSTSSSKKSADEEISQENTKLISSVKERFAVYRTAATPLGKNSLEVELMWRYFKTTGHYNYVGNFVPFTTDESYNETDGEFLLRYGLSRNFEMRGGINYRKNSSSITWSGAYAEDKSSAADKFRNDYSIINGSNSGLESALLGFKYALINKSIWNFAFDVYGKRSLFENTYLTDTSNPKVVDKIALGDERNEISFGMDIGANFFKNTLILSSEIFYSIPSKLSHEIRYDFESAYIPKIITNKIAFIAGIKGIKSLSTDDYSGVPGTKPKINTGPSYLYNSVNREYSQPFAGINLNITNSLQIKFRAARVLKGYSTDRGDEFLLSIVFRKAGISEKEEIIKKFKEYDIEAQVIKTSPAGSFVVVDKGITHDIEKGMRIDFYKFDYLGGNILLASGIVYESYAEKAIVKIVSLYKKTTIEVGTMARATSIDK